MGNQSTTNPTDQQLTILIREQIEAHNAASDDEATDALQKAQDAFAQLHERYSKLIFAYLAARTKSHADADEIHQQAWLRIWKALPVQFDGDNFRAWAYRIAYTTLVDRTRKKRPDSSSTAVELAVAPVVENKQEEIDQLRDCISKLDEERRIIVECRMSDMSHQTISDQFGIPLKTVHTRFHRAKEQLTECMKRALL